MFRLPFSIALCALCFAAPASARHWLGPTDNVLLENFYPNPTGNQFGRGVVSGDFDGDGIDDMAVSEPDGTRLLILRGVAFAVGTPHAFSFLANTVTLPGHNYAMASGDFDGDGRDEIAIGASETTYGGFAQAGQVYVLRRLSNDTWTVQSEIHAGGAFPGAPQAGAFFGNSLAAGDFNDDGFDDLAIGIRGQTVNALPNAGAVMITYGATPGITSTNARIIDRTSDGLTFLPKGDDQFGWSVAAADFDGDNDDDLAIGIINGSCPNGVDRGGAVVVLNGTSANGISNANSRIWRPGTLGIAGDCATADNFGHALATGFFGTNGVFGGPLRWRDLVIGAPGSDGGVGAAHVIFGSNAGLVLTGNQRLLPPALPGSTIGTPQFGYSVATIPVSFLECAGSICPGDGLAVGAPFAAINGVASAGVIWTFDGLLNGHGIVLDSARALLPVAPLKIAGPHADDQFGDQLAVGDFNGDGRNDLAIGVHRYDDGSATDSGAVQVIYQSQYMTVSGFD